MTTTFHIKQNDTSPAIEHQCEYQASDGTWNTRDLTGYQEVAFHLSATDGTLVIDDDTSGNVTVTDATNGIVKYEWQSGDTDTADDYTAEWEVTYSDGTIETFPNDEAGAPVVITPEGG